MSFLELWHALNDFLAELMGIELYNEHEVS